MDVLDKFHTVAEIAITLALVTGVTLFSGIAEVMITTSPGLLLAAHLVLLLIAGWVFVSTIIWTGSKDYESES